MKKIHKTLSLSLLLSPFMTCAQTEHEAKVAQEQAREESSHREAEVTHERIKETKEELALLDAQLKQAEADLHETQAAMYVSPVQPEPLAQRVEAVVLTAEQAAADTAFFVKEKVVAGAEATKKAATATVEATKKAASATKDAITGLATTVATKVKTQINEAGEHRAHQKAENAWHEQEAAHQSLQTLQGQVAEKAKRLAFIRNQQAAAQAALERTRAEQRLNQQARGKLS